MVLAGCFTLGMVFGHSEKADAAPIVLAEVVIESSVPCDACTEFEFLTDESIRCVDDGHVYDSEHFLVVADEDDPDSFYLVTWE